MLVVVLVMVALLSLLAAGYTLMVRAYLDGVTTEIRQFKIRQAASSGVQSAVVTLRYTRGDVDSWYNSPERYRAFLVSGPKGEEAESVQQKAVTGEVKKYDPTLEEAFRFSLIAPDFDDPNRVRYGITDESARMDLNSVTGDQLRQLLERVVPVNTDFPVNIDVLVDSFLDWREPGDVARPNGAKNEYYATLIPPYRSKGAAFSSIEELLLVRGFSTWVVYGEDYNQNGLLDPNEDDGDESFPPDDGNGVLYRGIAPFFTVWSQESNTSGDNRPRINLNMQDLDKLQEKLEQEIDGDITSYIISIRSAGIRFNSVMNLLPAPPLEEQLAEQEATSQPDDQLPPEEGQPQPPAQADGEDPTSQPSDENREDSNPGFADQDGSDPESENPPTSAPSGENPPRPPAARAPVYANLTDEEPPGSYEDLPLLLDRLSVSPSPILNGRINVSTAPREVLSMLEELSDEDVEAIVTARASLDSATKSSPSWLVSQGVISEYKFRRILDKITTKSSVYRVEAVGFADSMGIVERFMVILQMRGPVPQVLYYRNLNPLGMAYRPHGDELRGAQDKSK